MSKEFIDRSQKAQERKTKASKCILSNFAYYILSSFLGEPFAMKLCFMCVVDKYISIMKYILHLVNEKVMLLLA